MRFTAMTGMFTIFLSAFALLAPNAGFFHVEAMMPSLYELYRPFEQLMASTPHSSNILASTRASPRSRPFAVPSTALKRIMMGKSSPTFLRISS